MFEIFAFLWKIILECGELNILVDWLLSQPLYHQTGSVRFWILFQSFWKLKLNLIYQDLPDVRQHDSTIHMNYDIVDLISEHLYSKM